MYRPILMSVLLVGFAAGQEPPPFGTVIEQWNLPMSGGCAGSGITWRRSEGRFYLMDNGSSRPYVWRLDPADPLGTLEAAPWLADTFQGDTMQILWWWGLVWDPDSGCFWASGLVDGQAFGGYYLFRYVWNGDFWTRGGAPGDSWKVGDDSNGGGLECFWLAGMEKSTHDGRFYAAPVSLSPSEFNRVVMFDPYTKTNYGRVAHGDQISERGCALVPYDSNYILTCDWNRDTYCKRDSTGLLLDSVHAPGGDPADWSLHVPQTISPDDTVCVYCINSNRYNTLQRVSLGMLWWQLGSAVGVTEKRPTAHSRQPTATVCRGSLVLPRDMTDFGSGKSDRVPRPALLDATGRKVMDLSSGPNDISRLSPGVYILRSAECGERSAVTKVVVQR
jgi:hypothetical protein